MKIALFHNTGRGGAKRALCELMRQLSLRGHSIDLYTFSTSNDNFLLIDKFIQKKFVFEIKNSGYLRFRLYVFEIIYNLTKKLKFFFGLNNLSKIVAKKINNGGYDIAYVDLCRFTHAPFILRYLSIPNVYFCHNPLRNNFELGVDMPDRDKISRLGLLNLYTRLCNVFLELGIAIFTKIDCKNMSKAKNIFTNSYYTKEYIYRISGKDAKVVYLGVDAEIFKPLNLKRDNFILSVGRITRQKKFDFIISALSLISEDKRPKLVIVGLPNSEIETSSIIKLASIKKVKLEIKEEVEDEELVKLYNLASMVVFTPLMEPFGLVTLEAMACGTPVIGVHEGGLREVIKNGQTGILINRDEQELKDAIELLMERKDLSEMLSKNAREDILNNWTWEKAGNRLEDNLVRIIDENQDKQ